jgi:ABC-type glutathione transport system ATPase component
MARITTTLGLKCSSEFGSILPHEHIFVDLRTWNTPGYAQAEVEEVIQLMVVEIKKAQKVGVTG